MNICFLLPPMERYSTAAGGQIAEKAMQEGRRLEARGHEITVLAPAGDETPENQTPRDQTAFSVGRVYPLDWPAWESLSTLRRVVSRWRRKVRRWDFLYYEHYLSSVRQALRRMARPPEAILLFDDLVTPRYLKRELPEAKILCMLSSRGQTNQRDIRRTVNSVHKFVAASHFIEEWTAKRYGINADKLVTLADGADLDVFTPRPGFLSTPQTLRLLFIGAVAPSAGVDLAADAVALLRKENIAISLTIAKGFDGNGATQQPPAFTTELKEKLDNAGGEFLGQISRPQTSTVIRRYDTACILSRENAPTPPLAFEAMASGLAIVASDRGGLPETCDGAGWLVNVDDFASVVNALRTLATIPPVLNEYKRRSVARAARSTWEKNAEGIEKLLAD